MTSRFRSVFAALALGLSLPLIVAQAPNYQPGPRYQTPAANDNSATTATTAFVQSALSSRLALTGGTMSGALTIAPLSSSLVQGMTVRQTGAGTVTTYPGPLPNGYSYNTVLADDAIDLGTDPNYTVFGLSTFLRTGGATVRGTRTAIYGENQITSATSTTNPNRFYAGIGGISHALANDGGGVGTERGALFGGYFGSIIDPGIGGHFGNMTGIEVNIAAQTGSTVGYKSLIQLASLPSDTVRGGFEGMVAFSGNVGSAGWRRAMTLTDANGHQPLATDAAILATDFVGSATITTGFDVSGYTITGNAFKSKGFTLEGTGGINISGPGNADVTLNGLHLNFGPTENGTGTGHIQSLQPNSGWRTLDIDAGALRLNPISGGVVIETSGPIPTTSTTACSPGQHAWDGSYDYRCVATNTWKRATLSTW